MEGPEGKRDGGGGPLPGGASQAHPGPANAAARSAGGRPAIGTRGRHAAARPQAGQPVPAASGGQREPGSPAPARQALLQLSAQTRPAAWTAGAAPTARSGAPGRPHPQAPARRGLDRPPRTRTGEGRHLRASSAARHALPPSAPPRRAARFRPGPAALQFRAGTRPPDKGSGGGNEPRLLPLHPSPHLPGAGGFRGPWQERSSLDAAGNDRGFRACSCPQGRISTHKEAEEGLLAGVNDPHRRHRWTPCPENQPH